MGPCAPAAAKLARAKTGPWPTKFQLFSFPAVFDNDLRAIDSLPAICYKLLETMRTNPDIKLLEKVFKNYPEIEAVYLFGSAGTGKMHSESDIDLAIYPDTPGLREKKLSILTELAQLGFCDVDLVFMDPNDIVLQYEAVRQNVVVYQAYGFDRGSTYSKIVRQYLDFYPYLTEQRNAYKKRILSG